jgi:hypothetical protein
VFVVLLALVATVYQGSFMTSPRIEISYTRFIQEVERGNIHNLQIVEKVVTGELKSEVPVRPTAAEPRFKGFRTNILGDGSDLPDRVWKTNPGIEIDEADGLRWSRTVTHYPSCCCCRSGCADAPDAGRRLAALVRKTRRGAHGPHPR